MSILLLNANALHIPLADGSVNCVVTSPPYYGLRDYGTAAWMGGDTECDHMAQATGSTQNKGNNGKYGEPYKNVCGKCGAIRVDNQIGLEETPEAYVQKLVEVFREVKRVLSMDGTLWLNLGDSYSTGADNQHAGGAIGAGRAKDVRALGSSSAGWAKHRKVPQGCKPKDLIGIPWMVAFALRADGWYLRSDIIWHKPNPMPESVTDRPTKSHEYLFLLSKSAQYYYDAEAIMEDFTSQPTAPRDKRNEGYGAAFLTPLGEGLRSGYERGKRNKRDVWTVSTKPYSGAHFATFPPDLIEPCIKAGCPEGGIVLDPFAGSGTTALVARKLNRHAVGLDLSLTYLQECARPRLQLNIEEFYNGKKAKSNHSDLPLFSEQEQIQ